MRDPIAIVEAAFDVNQITRDVRQAKVALDDADRLVDVIGKKHETAQESQRLARVELGRLLIEAKRAVRHGEWLAFLENSGIVQQSASNWMRLAGYVESKLPTSKSVGSSSPTPTRREAGIDKRKRKADSKPVANACPDDEDDEGIDESTSTQDSESVVLASLIQTLGIVARQWPGNPTRLVEELRRYADKLERRMKEAS